MNDQLIMLTISLMTGIAAGVVLWLMTDKMVVRIDSENQNF